MSSLFVLSRSTKISLVVAVAVGSAFTASASGAASMPGGRPDQPFEAAPQTPVIVTPGILSPALTGSGITSAAGITSASGITPASGITSASGIASAALTTPDTASLGGPVLMDSVMDELSSAAADRTASQRAVRVAKAAPAPTIKVRKPATPTGLPAAIEPLPDYVAQTACEPGFRPGTAALAHLLQATYPGTHSGGVYACGTDGIISEHYDGRAIDWMNSVRNPVQAAQAQAVLHWLLDTDKAGNTFAIARRIGLMYVIWNNSIWSASDQRWDPYEDCAQNLSPSRDSFCHRNHIHISLSWDGAFGRTSFFSKHVVTRYDFGPCRDKDMNWAGHYTGPNYQGCALYPKLTPPASASPISKALIQWSGDQLAPGALGPAVAAVQNALAVPATATYDNATVSAVLAFKRAHKLVVNPVIAADTWRVLVAVSAKAAPTKPVPKKPVAKKPVTKRAPTKKPATSRPAPGSSAPGSSAPGSSAPGSSAPKTPAPPVPATPVPAPVPALPTAVTKPVFGGPGATAAAGIRAPVLH